MEMQVGTEGVSFIKKIRVLSGLASGTEFFGFHTHI